MSYSIYDKFLTVSSCKHYCNQAAKRLNLITFDYFYDKRNELQFPGDSNIKQFKEFRDYQDWQIKFNLCKPATIKKTGLDEYILKHRELTFHLTIKGYSFLYICKFSSNNHNETDIINGIVEPVSDVVYIEDEGGQLRFIL